MSIVGSKAVGVIGIAALDLAQYGEKSAKKFKLDLEKCKYEGAYIEVTLQRDMPKEETKEEDGEGNPNETSAEVQARQELEEEEKQEDMQSLYAISEELKAIGKEKVKNEYEHKIKYNQCNERYNILSTELENTKIEYNLLLESIEKNRGEST